MKQLRFFVLIVSLVTVIFACNKELSDESGAGAPQPSGWEFSETSLFAGGVDTGYIETTGGFQNFGFEGTSQDGKGSIVLQVSGAAITPGRYANPSVFFEYTENGSTVYYNVPTATDAFSVEILTIDSASVTGTFTGEVETTSGEKKTVTNGKFTTAIRGSTPTPPTSTAECKISRLGFTEINSGISYAAINATFNPANTVTNVVFYDSINQLNLQSYTINYQQGKVYLDADQYFELDANGRISNFHGYIDANNDPQAEKVIITYTFDADGYMVNAAYAAEIAPTVTFQEILFKWTGGNLTKMTIQRPGVTARIEVDYEYDVSKTPKSFLSFFPNYELVYMQSALDMGKLSTNLLSASKITSFDDNGTVEETESATYENHVMDADGYVQSFEVRGIGTIMQADTKYTLSYHCP